MKSPMSWRALAGPALFGAGAAIGARSVPGYRQRDEPISALAAAGSPAAKFMVPAFVALGVGTLGLGREIRLTRALPSHVHVMLSVAGATTAGAGLARCSSRDCPSRFLGDANATVADELHGVFSMATFLLWIALPAASAHATRHSAPAFARRSGILAGATLVAWLTTGLLVSRRSPRWVGAAQRLMVLAALSWFPTVASFIDQTPAGRSVPDLPGNAPSATTQSGR